MGELQVHRLQPDEVGVFEKKVLADVSALDTMLAEGLIESGHTRIGCEQEMFIIDRAWHPAPAAMELLEGLDPYFTTELARFNLEANLDSMNLEGHCLSAMEQALGEKLGQARRAARAAGTDILLTGILPTIRKSDLTLDNMTPVPRYYALNDAMCELRGTGYEFRLKGTDELIINQDSVMLESCCTSFQVHYQTNPDDFVALYNLAQTISAPLLAASANSPLLFGRRLWQETRIPLFQQAIDTRQANASLRQRSARVRFGEHWLDGSPVDLFREDIARFRMLLGATVEEDSLSVLRAGRIPELRALRIHNGTIYRWNRACYGVLDGVPHLRIENRVLPAGPTVLDEVANAAFFFGLLRGLPAVVSDVRAAMSFEDAEMNFLAAAQVGLGARFRWFGGQSVAARDLILEELLPVARSGLQGAGIVDSDIQRYLTVFEERVRERRNGALWLLKSMADMKAQSRDRALTAVTAGMAGRMWSGEPGHRWTPARIEEGRVEENAGMRVEQAMTTDLVTIHPDEPIEMAANLMDWNRIRHIPVEDDNGQVVGLISFLEVLKHLNREGSGALPVTVGAVMNSRPVTVRPETTLKEAVRLVGADGGDCLVVVEAGRLIGVVTPRDLIAVTASLLDREDDESK
jgi:CBS domain-containing protein/gamma-glutamyl:cysteine ligase YbdK (ATP-grasp superfamily)